MMERQEELAGHTSAGCAPSEGRRDVELRDMTEYSTVEARLSRASASPSRGLGERKAVASSIAV